MRKTFVFFAVALTAVSLAPGALRAQEQQAYRASLPLIIGWYNGNPAPYLQTEASDPALALEMNANYAPALANAANTAAVDDIYTVTNFKQGNIIPSAPIPAGPGNTNASYTPLWQVSMVTWNPGAAVRFLKSEAAVKYAEAAGEVTIVKTNIVVNCPVIHTQAGGLFPGATIHPAK